MKAPQYGVWVRAWIAAFILSTFSSLANLKPFPLSAGQRGTVTCLENPSVSYDIYLPPAYSTNGPPLPILYTLNPSGGGMVSSFQTVCANLNIICVGIKSFKNSTPWNPIMRDFYEVPRDIRQRVLFDPTAVFVGGFSGGGEASYIFSRFWSQHVTGVLAMGGWLGRFGNPPNGFPMQYYTTDRVQTNLLVARTTGTSDTAGLFYLPYDAQYLTSCDAVIKDWEFSGGHAIAPDATKAACLQWLLSQRIPAGPTDQSNALAQAESWRLRMAAGDSRAVLGECVSTLMNQPRTWFALEAQLVLDDMMTNYDAFRTLDVSNLFPASTSFTTNSYISDSVESINYWSPSDFAYDLFYYYARGAATNADYPRYDCALNALTGIAGANGDRDGDINYLLTKFNYPAPQIQIAFGQTNIWLEKDTPGLNYSLEWRSNLVNAVWQPSSILLSASDPYAGTTWSTPFDYDPTSTRRYYHVVATPTGDPFLPWPDNGGYGQ